MCTLQDLLPNYRTGDQRHWLPVRYGSKMLLFQYCRIREKTSKDNEVCAERENTTGKGKSDLSQQLSYFTARVTSKENSWLHTATSLSALSSHSHSCQADCGTAINSWLPYT